MVMFDSLNRRLLPPYGCDWTEAPNFTRLAKHTVTYDNCYAGSMPCMPARRELHSGRYNFLHRSWGPLEPFDDSMPELLKTNGVYTHLVTDHQHYWEDGGATFHGRYSSYEFFRGQEGDPWKGQVADPPVPESVLGLKALKSELWRQDWVNRQFLGEESAHPQTLTFDAGLDFINTNRDQDNWFLQIETFDPHEPFFSYADYKQHYDDRYQGAHFDWPDYAKVTEHADVVEHARLEYASLMTMCDHSLGRVLDVMDSQNMWEDTLLIVCTDHGFMLGEHGWWGKNVQPWYDETIHTPLFIWDPRSQTSGTRSDALVQTIDFAPTLLGFFGVPATPDMQGESILEVHDWQPTTRETALFGVFGGHACITDGRYVYMRASTDASNKPLLEHTLMPTQMRGFLPTDALRQANLGEPFSFTKGMPVLKIPARSFVSPWLFGTLLFDLETDPEQEHPIADDDLELRLATALRDQLIDTDAPAEQYQRLGLPRVGTLTNEHLLVREQWDQILASTAPPPRTEDFPNTPLAVTTPIGTLSAVPEAHAILQELAPLLVNGPLAVVGTALSPLQVAALTPAISTETLHRLAERLATIHPLR